MGYEDDLLKYLNTVISEADKRIVRGQGRQAHSSRSAAAANGKYRTHSGEFHFF